MQVEKKRIRELQSYLFVPLSDERFLRARSYERAAAQADALILDLEDSLPAAAKEKGRGLLADAFARFSKLNPNLIVRINNDRHWAADVKAARNPALAGVLVPKAESKDDLLRVREALGGSGAVIPLLETPAGILGCHALMRELRESLEVVFFGCEDLSAGLGLLDPSPRNMAFAAQHLLLAAAAEGLPVVGTAGSFSAFSPRLRAEYREILLRSRELGFFGAFAVHPSQLAEIRSVFRYEKELPRLREIVAAAEGERAVFSLGGRMYGPPMLRRYRRLLELFGG